MKNQMHHLAGHLESLQKEVLAKYMKIKLNNGGFRLLKEESILQSWRNRRK